MSTPIVPVPDVVLASEFPSLADRPAGTYNAKAKAWADSENAMATRTREIALTAKNNAEAAREAADEAVPAAATAVSARDKALEYKESAEATAAAVGVEAGLPSLVGNAGKALIVGPDEDAVGWYSAIPTIGVRQLDSAAAITAADQALMLRCDGTFTLSFAAVASMPAGWFCYIKNAGDGDITLDPDGSEQIDGLTSYIMYPGECRLIAHNGAEFVSVVLNGFYKAFTASGTFIKPPGYVGLSGHLWCGGNGGGNSSGGGGGGCFPFTVPAASVPESVSVIIGAGGIGGSTPTNGGNSSFGDITCYQVSTSSHQGSSVVADLNAFSSGSSVAPMGFNANSGNTRSLRRSVYGGGTAGATGGGSGDSTFGGGAGSHESSFAGTSVFAGNGGNAGQDGQAPAGGGGANANGARGELRIWGII